VKKLFTSSSSDIAAYEAIKSPENGEYEVGEGGQQLTGSIIKLKHDMEVT